MAKAAERPSKTCGSARVFIGDAEPRIRSDSLRSPHIFATRASHKVYKGFPQSQAKAVPISAT